MKGKAFLHRSAKSPIRNTDPFHMAFGRIVWNKLNGSSLRMALFPIFFCVCTIVPVGLAETFAFVFSLILCENAYQQIVDPSSEDSSRLYGCIKLFAPLVAVLTSGKSRFALALSTVLPYACFALRDTLNGRMQLRQHVSKIKCTRFPKVTKNSAALQDKSADVQVAFTEQHSPVVLSHGAQTSEVGEEAVVDCAALDDLQAEVNEIVRTGRPDPTDGRVVHCLVKMVRKSLREIVPEATVCGFTYESMAVAAAMGANAEIEIVATASPEVLNYRLLPLLSNTLRAKIAHVPEELQKRAARVLSENLPWSFKGLGRRRTALLSPTFHEFCTHPIRVSFLVNFSYPKHLAHILQKSDERSEALMLLVIRWVRIRGISDDTKGHLHPYGYIVLVMYFLRWRRKLKGGIYAKSVVGAFDEFVSFYMTLFENHDAAAVSVRFTSGQEEAKRQQRSFNHALDDLFLIPDIEDPLDASSNVADSMTPDGLTKFRQELARAADILSRGITSLAELFERNSPE